MFAENLQLSSIRYHLITLFFLYHKRKIYKKKKKKKGPYNKRTYIYFLANTLILTSMYILGFSLQCQISKFHCQIIISENTDFTLDKNKTYSISGQAHTLISFFFICQGILTYLYMYTHIHVHTHTHTHIHIHMYISKEGNINKMAA